MALAQPIQLTHSWPLAELETRFDLGLTFDAGDLAENRPHPAQPVGYWTCHLPDNELCWSSDVYRLFGLPSDAVLRRHEIVGLYAEPSRAAMEALRAHAIRHRRGFTLDAEIVPVSGARRWMRLTAAPVIAAGRVKRLWGFKADVTALYRAA